MLSSQQLRQKYLEFFASKEHSLISSASLIPENDPTVLFTTAGMHPLVPYLLGEKHPGGKRVANVQKCVRTGDIDEVGDNRHLTFFEMMGNWSFGDYFKKEAIAWSWEFLTSSSYLGLDPRLLAVSVFAGDADAPKDEESAGFWKSLGVPENRIGYLPKKNNWWGPAGQTGPCGPDTEMFFWRPNHSMGQAAPEFPPENSNPATDEDNWLEIWNDVFMQYNKKIDGTFEPLKQQNVDTGMGLERTLVVLNGNADVFQIDTLWPLIQKIQEISGREYIENQEVTKSMRIIADHLRTATMIMGDDRGIAPSNVDQGYIVRRLIRRAVRQGRQLGIKENFCSLISEEVIKIFKDVYPELLKNKEFVLTEMAQEESKFRNTIEQGLKEFEKFTNNFSSINNVAIENIKEINGLPINKVKTWNGVPLKKILSGENAFKLYQSYGFPIEMTVEEVKSRKIDLTEDEEKELIKQFKEEFEKHQDLSRVGSEKKFKGGLADHSEMSTKYHTATHLLHAALRKVLGDHAQQRGSNITAERLRFDFSHPEKMTDEQKKQVEDLINYAIGQDYHVSFAEMSIDEAKAKNAVGLFEDKYESRVKVYTIGDTNELADAHINSLTFSREICGGPHVEHTNILGKFRIVKEEAVSSGIRRIKAILE